MTKMNIALATALSLAASSALADSVASSSSETDMRVSTQSGFVMDPGAHENNGMMMYNKDSIAMPQETFKSLANARGETMKTTGGETVGVVEEVNYNTRGNPELVVDISDNRNIQADELVITVTPSNVKMMGGALVLDTTLADLTIEANKNAKDIGDRTSVTLF